MNEISGTRKFFRPTACALSLAAACVVFCGTADASQIYLNGQVMTTSVPPVEIAGRTLLPMRDVFERLGATVHWNQLTQGIEATRGTTSVEMQINNRDARLNGQPVTLDQPPQIWNGSTMVPIRFVAEALGADVGWNQTLQVVSIVTHDQPAPVKVAALAAGPAVPYVAPAITAPSYTAPPPTVIVVNPGPVVAPPIIPAPSVNQPRRQQVASYRTISVPSGAVVPLTLDQPLSSATARVGQLFRTTVLSQRLGDSEFPVGSKLEGMVVEARPRSGGNPGVLDIDFRNVIFPDGRRQALQGELTSLDSKNVTMTQGRLVAKPTHTSNDRLKVVGIGAGVGFVLGRLLHQNTILATVLGGAGGYFYDQSRQKQQASEAVLPQNAHLAARLVAPISYPDINGYAGYRSAYLRTAVDQEAFQPAPVAYTPPEVGTAGAYSTGDYPIYADQASQASAVPEPINGSSAPVYPPQSAGYTPAETSIYPPPAENAPNPVPAYQVAGAAAISVPAGAVVQVSLDQPLSSASAQVGQVFTASVVTERLGDSEFPVGSKLEGMVVEARPRAGSNPGVLDVDFRNVVFRDGSRQPLQGELISLENNSNVTMTQGRIMARQSPQSSQDRTKVIGVGAGIGYVLGRALDMKHESTVIATILGGAGGYLFDKNRQQKQAAEASLPRSSRLAVRLKQPVVYADTANYRASRMAYLRVPSYR